MRTKLLALALMLALVGGDLWFYKVNQSPTAKPTPTSEQITLIANTGGCYGASCNGKNPSDYCTDGITVAARPVTDGLLELRYSRSCKANWGRYTPWGRNGISGFFLTKGIYARVTAWNPGGPSYTTAHHDMSADSSGSSWSQMVDGQRKPARASRC